MKWTFLGDFQTMWKLIIFFIGFEPLQERLFLLHLEIDKMMVAVVRKIVIQMQVERVELGTFLVWLDHHLEALDPQFSFLCCDYKLFLVNNFCKNSIVANGFHTDLNIGLSRSNSRFSSPCW